MTATIVDPTRCAYCQERPAAHGRRGLCHTCHRKPDVRQQFPTIRSGRAAALGQPLCVHCNELAGDSHRRGLCYRCWRTPGVRPAQPENPADDSKLPWNHCKVRKQRRPRGLCWSCFDNPFTRLLYAVSDHPAAHRGVGTGDPKTTAPVPTNALPGTAEKMAVLEARAAAGQDLFHPLDAKHEGTV